MFQPLQKVYDYMGKVNCVDRHNMYNIVKEIMYIIIIYKYNAHSMTYSLSMLQKNLDLILALTFTCRMPGK